MHKKHNKFLVISFTLVFILGVYSYFYNDLINKASSADSSLTSSLGTTPSTTSNDASAKAALDTAFLMDLNSLTKIKIDSSLFDDQSFKLLVDNKVQLDQVSHGRINPFSPTDKAIAASKPVFVIKTNPVTNITKKSAVLNGSLDGIVTNNIYFEYGTSPALGSVTPKVTTSSVGSFAAIISNLTTKTTYFYRASANINGTPVMGDIVSFSTN